MTRRARASLTALFGVLAIALASPVADATEASASTPVPTTSLFQMESQVMCVTCRTPLSVGNGPEADKQRALIRRLIASGDTPAQIKAQMVDEYGQQALALPDDNGFNVAVYLVPVLGVALGIGVALFFLPRWRRHARRLAARGPEQPGAALSGVDARRLDDDIARYD